MSLITGSRRGEFLLGTAGSDEIFGLPGNDEISGHGGVDLAKGGKGDDDIRIDFGVAFGGKGNDDIFGESAVLGGGPGTDLLRANGGALYGDEVPGERAPRFGGADTLIVNAHGFTAMTGGGGTDKFIVNLTDDGVGSDVHIKDFKEGVDKVGLTIVTPVAERGTFADVFNLLDSNDDLVLDANDAPAADGSSGVFADAANNRLVVWLEATDNGLGTDRDHLVIDNVTHFDFASLALTF